MPVCETCKEMAPATREQLEITKGNAQRFGLDQVVPPCPKCGSRDWAISDKYFRNLGQGPVVQFRG